MPIAAGDVLRITKNGHGFRNSELVTVKEINRDNVTVSDGRSLHANGNKLHLDKASPSRAMRAKERRSIT
jgi:hypothetical protein